jgi:hypothetical protein
MATKGKAKEKKEENVRIAGLQRVRMRVPIKGLSPLLCNKFSDRQKDKIEAKQQKESSVACGREKRNPDQEFKDSLYKMEDGRYGFPASGFKKAMVSAAGFTGGQLKKTTMRGAFHIVGDMAAIKGSPRQHTSTVRLKNGAADMRYRAIFDEWETELDVLYNESVISKEQIIQLIHLAGFSVGVGDWRPERSGSFGMFDVKQGKE